MPTLISALQNILVDNNFDVMVLFRLEKEIPNNVLMSVCLDKLSTILTTGPYACRR